LYPIYEYEYEYEYENLISKVATLEAASSESNEKINMLEGAISTVALQQSSREDLQSIVDVASTKIADSFEKVFERIMGLVNTKAVDFSLDKSEVHKKPRPRDQKRAAAHRSVQLSVTEQSVGDGMRNSIYGKLGPLPNSSNDMKEQIAISVDVYKNLPQDWQRAIKLISFEFYRKRTRNTDNYWKVRHCKLEIVEEFHAMMEKSGFARRPSDGVSISMLESLRTSPAQALKKFIKERELHEMIYEAWIESNEDIFEIEYSSVEEFLRAKANNFESDSDSGDY